jgi:hypothetical protein
MYATGCLFFLWLLIGLVSPPPFDLTVLMVGRSAVQYLQAILPCNKRIRRRGSRPKYHLEELYLEQSRVSHLAKRLG